MVTDDFILLLLSMQSLPSMILYAGPDQLLPLASFLGVVIGSALNTVCPAANCSKWSYSFEDVAFLLRPRQCASRQHSKK
jgi:hypothetical protein